MSFLFEERASDSPFVETVWRSEDTADGLYLAAADGQWDLVFTKTGQGTRVLLSGPSSHAAPVPYKQGNRNFGVRFKPGVFMTQLFTSAMVDVTKALPQASKHSFWLQDQPWQLPTFNNVDVFIDSLARQNVLAQDLVVETVLAGKPNSLSPRSVQRHFLRSTGLTHRYIQQIKRANHAVALLQQGKSISEVVVELGFADQAHMTRQVKRISGCTPGEIAKKVEACRLRSIQRYGVCAEMRVQNFKGVSYDDKTV